MLVDLVLWQITSITFILANNHILLILLIYMQIVKAQFLCGLQLVARTWSSNSATLLALILILNLLLLPPLLQY